MEYDPPAMDVSELRKRILHALDDARRQAKVRRESRTDAELQWDAFLSNVAVPLFRQAASVLQAERHPFTVHTPASSVRVASDASADTFLELALDLSGSAPAVMGRLSIGRGRNRQTVEETPIGVGKAVADITEDDVARFLVTEIPKLVVRS